MRDTEKIRATGSTFFVVINCGQTLIWIIFGTIFRTIFWAGIWWMVWRGWRWVGGWWWPRITTIKAPAKVWVLWWGFTVVFGWYETLSGFNVGDRIHRLLATTIWWWSGETWRIFYVVWWIIHSYFYISGLCCIICFYLFNVCFIFLSRQFVLYDLHTSFFFQYKVPKSQPFFYLFIFFLINFIRPHTFLSCTKMYLRSISKRSVIFYNKLHTKTNFKRNKVMWQNWHSVQVYMRDSEREGDRG